jgi:tRNA nucleotidyltransferase/poly(A) polymerase
MNKTIKNAFKKIDRYFYKKFGSAKSIKYLENIKEAQIIFACLNDVGQETNVRFVGGCVRKVLLGEEVDDIDLATSLEPNEVKNRLNLKNIKVIDTGILHGTVTAIINKKKFEITTLRKDLATDGRHASVEFTLDWGKDASRRDFTINAIYADIEGRIFDPLNGIQDLKNGKIKFIGSAEERIQEDYLRILRYFRFIIQYSNTDNDQDTIRYIKKHINGINKISSERIFDELKKILALKNIYNLFIKTELKEIVLNLFPQFKHYERLKILNNLNKKLRNRYDNNLILGLLIIDRSSDCEYFCHKYKLSNKLKNRFMNISSNLENLKNKNFYTQENLKKLIYLSNKFFVTDLLLFSVCVYKKDKILDIARLIDFTNTCKVPKFKISGDDLKKYGYRTGPKLGEKLKLIEKEWIENNFVLDNNIVEKNLK